MQLKDAIKTSIDYEKKIRDVYKEAGESFKNSVGKSVALALAEDEQHHVEYLESKLTECRSTGNITLEVLNSSIPSKEEIHKNMESIKEPVLEDSFGNEKMLLNRALKLEIETSAFYSKMVNEMTREGKELFAHFLEIEHSHISLVEAELDYFNRTGYWFDIKEFDME